MTSGRTRREPRRAGGRSSTAQRFDTTNGLSHRTQVMGRCRWALWERAGGAHTAAATARGRALKHGAAVRHNQRLEPSHAGDGALPLGVVGKSGRGERSVRLRRANWCFCTAQRFDKTPGYFIALAATGRNHAATGSTTGGRTRREPRRANWRFCTAQRFNITKLRSYSEGPTWKTLTLCTVVFWLLV